MTRSEPGTLSPVDKVLCLQHVDVFKYATTEMLAYISSIASEVRVTRNEVVFREGDVSYAMYVVVKGRVRLDKEDREVMTVGDCQSFGTWALFDNQPRLMTATAVLASFEDPQRGFLRPARRSRRNHSSDVQSCYRKSEKPRYGLEAPLLT